MMEDRLQMDLCGRAVLTIWITTPKHKKHLRDRWDVWKRGYGLVCDVGGVLYTYDKP
jgi:hypothetical protein